MENRQHIKAYNTNTSSKKRIKYLSARQRAKAASADVYRSYSSNKRRWTSTREEAVHAPDVYTQKNIKKKGENDSKKRRRVARDDQDGMTVIVQDSQNNDMDEE